MKAPWDVMSLDGTGANPRGSYIVDADLNILARVIDDEAEDMLAAGPELLAALKGVVRVADRATDEFDAARAAIAKAEARDV